MGEGSLQEAVISSRVTKQVGSPHCSACSDEMQISSKLVPTDERRRQIVKRPKWLPWESSETKSDHLKKVRQQTDQRMKQQEVQKEEGEKNQSLSIGSAIDRPAR
jgi:hypothetical protein